MTSMRPSPDKSGLSSTGHTGGRVVTLTNNTKSTSLGASTAMKPLTPVSRRPQPKKSTPNVYSSVSDSFYGVFFYIHLRDGNILMLYNI